MRIWCALFFRLGFIAFTPSESFIASVISESLSAATVCGFRCLSLFSYVIYFVIRCGRLFLWFVSFVYFVTLFVVGFVFVIFSSLSVLVQHSFSFSIYIFFVIFLVLIFSHFFSYFYFSCIFSYFFSFFSSFFVFLISFSYFSSNLHYFHFFFSSFFHYLYCAICVFFLHSRYSLIFLTLISIIYIPPVSFFSPSEAY